MNELWPFCSHHTWQPFVTAFAVLSVIGVFLAFYNDLREAILEPLKSSNMNADAIQNDGFLEMKSLRTFQGPFYSCNMFIPIFHIMNLRSEELVVSQIDFYFVNPKVQELIPGFPADRYGSYFHLKHSGGYWRANEERVVMSDSFPTGPVFIPREVYVEIYHSGSEAGSHFRFALSNDKDVEYWTKPRHIDFDKLDVGIDRLHAYRQAKDFADQLMHTKGLAMGIPMKTIATKLPNALDNVAITEWGFLFAGFQEGRGIWVNIDSAGARGGVVTSISHPDLCAFLVRASTKPLIIGTRQAVSIADQNNLIFANTCQGVWLEPDGLVGEERHPIWKLPYVGSNYMTLFIDGFTGEVLEEDLEYQRKGKGPPWRFRTKK
ncbi:MAG: hypothetical protein V1799_00630 [bacterium]